MSRGEGRGREVWVDDGTTYPRHNHSRPPAFPHLHYSDSDSSPDHSRSTLPLGAVQSRPRPSPLDRLFGTITNSALGLHLDSDKGEAHCTTQRHRPNGTQRIYRGPSTPRQTHHVSPLQKFIPPRTQEHPNIAPCSPRPRKVPSRHLQNPQLVLDLPHVATFSSSRTELLRHTSRHPIISPGV